MKVLLVFSLLVIYASAEFSLHASEPFDVCGCNVSESSICVYFERHEPMKERRFEGLICHDDRTARIIITGTEYAYTNDNPTPTKTEFAVSEFYRPYSFVANNQTIRVEPRIIYVYSQGSNGIPACNKFPMYPDEKYHKLGLPSDYTCIGDITEGWLNPDHNDGVVLKMGRKESKYDISVRTVTKKLCFPVRHFEYKVDAFKRVDIIEETTYHPASSWVIPTLEPECWGI